MAYTFIKTWHIPQTLSMPSLVSHAPSHHTIKDLSIAYLSSQMALPLHICWQLSKISHLRGESLMDLHSNGYND